MTEFNLFNQPEFEVHSRESNHENEAILNENRKRLSRNCQTIFSALMRGEVLNSVLVSSTYRIIDFRRRICDLKDNGVRMQWEKSKMGKGLRNWFMSEEDKIFNKKFCESK